MSTANNHHHHHHHHVKKERVDSPSSTTIKAPYSLKISKDSHPIKKPTTTSSPPSSSSSSATPSAAANHHRPQQRHPVIIYTHSPKIIHTHPKDFMALVQKLTGLSRSNNVNHRNHYHAERNVERKKIPVPTNDDNDSTSVVTDENNSGSGETQVNSCFVAPAMFEPSPNLYYNGYPFYGPNAASELWCSDHHHYHSQQFNNYSYPDDSSFLYMPDMRNSSPMDMKPELPKY